VKKTYLSRGSRCCFALLIAQCVSAFLCGCREQSDEIQVYRVPKKEKRRILAAMIPHGESFWVFKVDGSSSKVDDFSGKFSDFLQTVRFDERPDAEPTWKLPDGWGQLPDDHPKNQGQFKRFATVFMPDKNAVERVEIAVSSLPYDSRYPWDQYVLQNVNRWRRQLELPPLRAISDPDLGSELKIDDDHTATVVNLAQGTAPPIAPPPTTPPKRELPFTFKAPAAWSAGSGSSISVLAFQVSEMGKKIDVTVTPAGGGLLPNINRWRRQVGLGAIDQDQLEKDVQKLEAGTVKFSYVELVGPEKSILAAVGDHGGVTWFIKLSGNSELAKREEANFEAFVKSIRFKP
jgi:hypothetical protein